MRSDYKISGLDCSRVAKTIFSQMNRASVSMYVHMYVGTQSIDFVPTSLKRCPQGTNTKLGQIFQGF